MPLCVITTWSRSALASRARTQRIGRRPFAGSRLRAAGNRAPLLPARACRLGRARSSASVRPSKLPHAISTQTVILQRIGETQQLGCLARPAERARDAGRIGKARRQPPRARLRPPETTQRDVRPALDATGLVPARARMADQADAHAGALMLARASNMPGPRGRRDHGAASTRACAVTPMARSRAGSPSSARTAAARRRRRARLDQNARGAVGDDVRDTAFPARDHRHACRLSLQECHAVGLVAGRPDIEIGHGVDLMQRHWRLDTQPSHPMAERREQCGNLLARLAIADQIEPPRQIVKQAKASASSP